jgi:hypothetical protein
MKGSRPYSDAEVAQVATSFSGVYARRNKALFVVGVRTGFRISERLSTRTNCQGSWAPMPCARPSPIACTTSSTMTS